MAGAYPVSSLCLGLVLGNCTSHLLQLNRQTAVVSIRGVRIGHVTSVLPTHPLLTWLANSWVLKSKQRAESDSETCLFVDWLAAGLLVPFCESLRTRNKS